MVRDITRLRVVRAPASEPPFDDGAGPAALRPRVGSVTGTVPVGPAANGGIPDRAAKAIGDHRVGAVGTVAGAAGAAGDTGTAGIAGRTAAVTGATGAARTSGLLRDAGTRTGTAPLRAGGRPPLRPGVPLADPGSARDHEGVATKGAVVHRLRTGPRLPAPSVRVDGALALAPPPIPAYTGAAAAARPALRLVSSPSTAPSVAPSVAPSTASCPTPSAAPCVTPYATPSAGRPADQLIVPPADPVVDPLAAPLAPPLSGSAGRPLLVPTVPLAPAVPLRPAAPSAPPADPSPLAEPDSAEARERAFWLGRVLAEVLSGARPVPQLRPYASVTVYGRLSLLALRFQGRDLGRLTLRSSGGHAPADGVAEGYAHLCSPSRGVALAFRLERDTAHRSRRTPSPTWVCTALEHDPL